MLNWFKKIFKSRTFWVVVINLFLAGGVVVGGIALVIWGLDVYTRHGEKIEVPDIIGLHVEDAEKELQALGLELKVTDSVFSKEFDPSEVLFQNPPSGDYVKKNRIIYVTMRQVRPNKSEIPNVIGESVYNATDILRRAGFDNIGSPVLVINESEGAVLGLVDVNKKEIKVGETRYVTDSIKLKVGAGTGDAVAVPDLRGITVVDAAWVLKSYKLSISAVVPDETIKSPEDSINAIIYKQLPAPGQGATMREGESIDVWHSLKEYSIVSDIDSTNTVEPPTDTTDSASN